MNTANEPNTGGTAGGFADCLAGEAVDSTGVGEVMCGVLFPCADGAGSVRDVWSGAIC